MVDSHFCRRSLAGIVCLISLVDRLDKLKEAGRFFQRPKALKRWPKQLHIALSEQPDSHDLVANHNRPF